MVCLHCPTPIPMPIPMELGVIVFLRVYSGPMLIPIPIPFPMQMGTVPNLTQILCYLGKRHSGTLVIIYPLLCNVSLNIRVKQ